MGRHAGPAPRDGAPGLTEVLGWGVFTAALVVGALLWFGVPWVVAAAVGATVLAGIGAVAAAMAFAPRGEQAAPREGSGGSPPGPAAPPR